MTKKSYNILLSIIAALLVVGGLSYWVWTRNAVVPAQQTSTMSPPVVADSTASSSLASPIDTSTWKTYQNQRYGIQFKYPDEVNVSRRNILAFNYSFLPENYDQYNSEQNYERRNTMKENVNGYPWYVYSSPVSNGTE